MINKKEFLLQSIIREYIENLEPIGSKQLKSMCDIPFSSATIRGNFKKLGEEGYLSQEHISSGRTPTTMALKEYWYDRLNFKLPNVDYVNLKFLAQSMGLSVFIEKQNTKRLQRIINIENIYMVLEFSPFSEKILPYKDITNEFVITIRYSSALYRFLNEMINMNLRYILNIARQVGATQLYDELNKYIQKSEFDIVNVKNFLSFLVNHDLPEESIQYFLQGDVLEQLDDGIYFEDMLPSGYIGICHSTNINQYKAKMLVVGKLSKNYEYFYKGIM